MDWTAGPRAPLGFAALLLLGRLSISAARGYAHSLCYNFTIDPQPSRGEPWCVVQGQVDGNVFLSYDCGGAKVQSTSPLGEVVRTMNTWETQTETLRDIGDFLKWQLPDVILEKHMASGPLTLQARMMCRWEKNGHISGSWQFGFNGQTWLLFDSENGHWTVVHSEGRRMKEKWENDRAATDFLKKVSMRDCWAGLQDFMVRWEKMLKSAGDGAPRKPLTGALSASGLSLCLAAFLLLLFTLEPRSPSFGIPSLSTSYDDTVAAPSRVSCRI
ncbi:UL16-binding protein 3-like isoform X4 [Muntiacus reevesi]|uniref:UL16-binding protein 3-like isoform X4 n=1 Tax=Muntiacus reevesi TaxID=9886 RepID=UPI0033079FAC